MSKKGRWFFQEKIRVTPSVSAPGDTNPSDATALFRSYPLHVCISFFRVSLQQARITTTDQVNNKKNYQKKTTHLTDSNFTNRMLFSDLYVISSPFISVCATAFCLCDSNFIKRMLYKDSYWLSFISSVLFYVSCCVLSSQTNIVLYDDDDDDDDNLCCLITLVTETISKLCRVIRHGC